MTFRDKLGNVEKICRRVYSRSLRESPDVKKMRDAGRARIATRSVAGGESNSVSVRMFYTYVLRCGDGKLYVGSTTDLRNRISQHRAGNVRATAHRLPVKLEHYEACGTEIGARLREKQLTTGFARAYLSRRLR